MKLLAICLYFAALLAQFGAVVVAISAFLYASKYKVGWLVLASGLILMLGPRILPIAFIYDTGFYNLIHAALALPISILLLVGVITVRKMVCELNESKTKLSIMLQVDALTGAYSRTEILNRIENEIERSKRNGLPLTIMEVDIDHFKKVNDEHGHNIGDEVLFSLTNCCLKSIRKIDSYGRIGGEEFIVLLPETNVSAAQDMAERLRSNVEHFDHPISIGKHIGITISIGITTFDPLSDVAKLSTRNILEQLIKQADQAMYSAKANGRNRVVVWAKPITA